MAKMSVWWGDRLNMHCYRREMSPASYQYLKQLLQVTSDQSVVFVKRPAPLLGVVPVPGEVTEDNLQPLFVMTHLTLWQRRTQVLQRHKTL